MFDVSVDFLNVLSALDIVILLKWILIPCLLCSDIFFIGLIQLVCLVPSLLNPPWFGTIFGNNNWQFYWAGC